MDLREVQERLKALGFDPGPIDGIPGRQTTAAVTMFQKARGLVIQWPGTIGPKTLAALFPTEDFEDAPPPVTSSVARPWYDIAIRKKGLHEGRDHSEVAAFLKSDRKTLGDPRRLPWCGDFVETCIALALPSEALPVNPYLARNWLKFGVPCEPQLGAVLVFWRGSKSGTSGHVGFDAGAGPGKVYVLGGNQSNSVSVAPLGTDRLLGARWPKTVPLPDRIIQPKMVGGKLSTNEA